VRLAALALLPLLVACDHDAPRASSSMPAHDSTATHVLVRLSDGMGGVTAPQKVAKVVKTDAEWQAQLPPETYRITRSKGTERPFCGTLLDNKKSGAYHCVCCDLPLFSSDAKFNSGTGWPSFFQPIAPENVATLEDRSHGMVRVEILCARCDAHLGHVFPDGPPPTRERHCLNSESLTFKPRR
jgi:methionine-R-sulfoxide reductase